MASATKTANNNNNNSAAPSAAAAVVAQSKSTTASPKDVKKNLPTKNVDNQAQSSVESNKTSPRQSEQTFASVKEDASTLDDSKAASNATQPLAPPPKPGQQQQQQQNANGEPDYFSGRHSTAHFQLEPNPFEQSFGNPSTETPGKFAGLPSVASLTSPAPLGASGTPGWQIGNSLRSGPLSPAMLPGPQNPSGYFDEQFRQSFPTPNESSLRTGLTPGGGGSMFPAPSPNSQAIFNSMQNSGLATPGTLEFQRTAMNAAARSRSDAAHQQPVGATPAGINKQDYQPAQQANMGHQDPFNHPDRDAVNSLYMLAQTGNRNANQFAIPNQPHEGAPNAQMQQPNRAQTNTSPSAGRGGKQSIGSLEDAMSENGDEDQKGPIKAKGKKGAAAKNTPANKKKAEDMPKGSSNKRAKGNNGQALSPMDDMDMMDDMDSDDDIKDEDGMHPNGKKMTDDEKRKNFLERNRIAALKCRQRKKQWLANLQAKVEIFTSENDALSQQNQRLQDEVVNLKSLLLAHKDCPVSHQQGLGGNLMSQVLGSDFTAGNANPYGMGMPPQNGGHMMPMAPSQGMQRR